MLGNVGMALVAQQETHTRIEESEFAIAMLQLLEIKFGNIFERVGGCKEGDARALFRLAVYNRRIADNLERRFRIAVAETHPMLFAFAPDGKLKPFGQGVHNGNADAMKPA